MAKHVFTNTRLFVGGVDLTGVSNKAEVSAEVEAKDVTTFGSGGYKEFLGGLASTSINAEGFFESGTVSTGGTWEDPALFTNLGIVGPWTVCPTDGNVSSIAYFTNVLQGSYDPVVGGVGDAAGYKAMGMGNWPLVRGVVANPVGTARTASGSGTAIQLGAVSATQQLYAALHVVSVSGTTPSATFRIESDDAAGFASPTTRLTFDAATGVTSQILRTSVGAITDTHYRAAWTISGTSPSFLAIVSFGIK